MKKTILFIGLTTALIACSGTKESADSTSQPSIFDFDDQFITQEKLYSDLSVLASDSLQGRETGTQGLQLAADYLANRYREAGLQPVGDEGTYFQHFDVVQPIVRGHEYKVYEMVGDSAILVEASSHNKDTIGNFITLYGGGGKLDGEIVFSGYGMYNEDEGVNHYPDSVEGKWLLLFYDRSQTNRQKLQELIFRGGAAGALLIFDTDTDGFIEEARAQQQHFGQASRMSLAYLQEENDTESTPAYNRISPEISVRLLGMRDTAAVSELMNKIKEAPAGFQAKEIYYKMIQESDSEKQTLTTKNIAAYLEGSDPVLKNEVVVLSAHYDHVGVGRPDSTGDTIYNGADDDGSGTVATLLTAEAMAAAKAAGAGPKRSVLFLSVAGEEKGLLGSRYYSDHPIYAIENTVANINIDMIGRLDPEHKKDTSYVYVIGGRIISSGLDSLLTVANNLGSNITLSSRYNDLEDPNQFYRRSDHWNFGRLGVPFVFFFNGTHEDYHRPSDEVQKINFEALRLRTELVYNTTAVVANADKRPEVDNQEFIEKTKVSGGN